MEEKSFGEKYQVDPKIKSEFLSTTEGRNLVLKTQVLIRSVDEQIGGPIKNVLRGFRQGELSNEDARKMIMELVESKVETYLNTIEGAKDKIS